MSKTYKITAKQVREAAKKTGLEIDEGGYFINNLFGKTICACPLGQLYAINHHDNRDGNECAMWAKKKFGLYFRNGFTDGFDGHNGQFYLKGLKGKNRQNYLDGYRNGKNLRRYLLGK